MKAEELNKGNIVENKKIDIFNKGYVEIHARHIYEMAVKESSQGYNDYVDFFKPITMSEKFHNLFGVYKNGFDSYEYILERNQNLNIKIVFFQDYIMLRQGKGGVDDDLISIWNNDVTRREIYVHEFQNMYRALSGKGLAIQ